MRYALSRIPSQSVWLFVLGAIFVAPIEGARAQTIAGYAIGDNRSRLDVLGNVAWQQSFGEYTNGSVDLGKGVKVSTTSHNSSGKLVRLEASWDGVGRPQPAFFSDFSFGSTTLSSIRQRFGNSGMLPNGGSPVLSTTDGGVAISSFYEVAGSDVVAAFVTKISRNALVDLKQRYGADTYSHMAAVAKLDSVVIWDAIYFENVRGKTPIADIGYGPIVWKPADAVVRELKREISLARIKPSQLPVTQVYSGPNNFPDIRSLTSSVRRYSDKIIDGMAAGPNFAGEYAVIQINCGTGCLIAFAGNVRTGDVSQLPVGGRTNTNLALQYERNSRLMTAQWSNASAGKCLVQFFSFEDGEWVELLKREVGSFEKCQATLAQNLR